MSIRHPKRQRGRRKRVKRNPFPGICRVDQSHKHHHGFFVRLQRDRAIHSAFFSDRQHGSRAKALAAARRHYRVMKIKLGEPQLKSRRNWAEIPRRIGRSGIYGVQRFVDRRGRRPVVVWKATWSPRPYVVKRTQFSVRKHGALRAKQLAIRARRRGLRQQPRVNRRAQVAGVLAAHTRDSR